MRKRTIWITGAASAAVVLGGASIAVGATQQARDLQSLGPDVLTASIGKLALGDDPDGPALTDAARARATSAALAKVGQGSVTEVERGDGSGAAYKVEVRLNDGTQVDVSVGADFQVMSQSTPEHDED